MAKYRTLVTLAGIALTSAVFVASCGKAASTPTATATPTKTATAPTATVSVAPTATTAASPTPTNVPTPTPRPTPTTVPTPSAPQPKYGGTMSMRISGAFANEWDTYSSAGRNSVIITENLLSNLTFIDARDGSTIRPDLAESWTLSPDGKTLTYQLRKDVKWQDGKSLVASDVVASLERARKPDNPANSVHAARLAIVTGITATSDSTVQITLSRPSASFLVVMSVPNLTIYPAKPIADWKTQPIGTGPFKFKAFKANESAEFVRNDSYFKSDAKGNKLPYLDGVKYIWVIDQNLAFSAFRTGQLSCACGFSSDIIDTQKDQAVSSIPGVKFGTSWKTDFLQLNDARKPFSDLKVRQGLSIGFDRSKLSNVIPGGAKYYPPAYFVPDQLDGKLSLTTKELLQTPGYKNPKAPDTQMAKQLFDQANFDPKQTTIAFVATNANPEIKEAITSILMEMGFKVNLQMKGTAETTQALIQGNFDITLLGGGGSFDDPSDVIVPSAKTGGGLNYGRMSNAKIDQLLNDQDSVADPAKRRSMIIDLQKELLSDASFTPAYSLAGLYAAQPYVEGYDLDRAYVVSSAFRLDRVWFNR